MIFKSECCTNIHTNFLLYPLAYYITYMPSFQHSTIPLCVAYMYVLYFYVVGCVCQPQINEHVKKSSLAGVSYNTSNEARGEKVTRTTSICAT